MSNSINLVSPKNEQLEKEQNRLKAARILAFSVMLAVVLIAALVFIVNLTLPINSIKQDEQNTLSNISAFHTKLAQYYLVEDRVTNLSNIIEKRKKLPDIADAVLATVPQDLAITTMQIDAKQVSFVVSGKSLISMNKFIDDVTALDKSKKIIKNIVVQQLSADIKNGNYSVSVQADTK